MLVYDITNKTMLVQFKFHNYKCFKDDTVLNVVASNYFKDEPENIFATPFYSVVKSAAVFGANASGKTKLFLAFDFMRTVVIDSANSGNSNMWKQKYDTYRSSTETINANSSFEAVFLIDNIQYRYGFELNKERIVSEWLFRKKTKEINVIFRDESDLYYNTKYINKKVANILEEANMIRDNALFLSALSLWNDELSQKVYKWFYDSNILSTSINNYMGYSLDRLDSPMKARIVEMMKEADFNIENLEANEIRIENIPDEIKKFISKEASKGKIYNGVKTVHKVYDENYMPVGTVEMSLENDESYGTNKFFALSAPIMDTLDNGKRLWVDEIDHGLHFELLIALIKLFHSPKTNPHNAQLIINTHNVELLNEGVFRRDQIFITSKNRYGEAEVKPITVFNSLKLRKDSKIGGLYKDGKLGGTPYLGDFGASITKY